MLVRPGTEPETYRSKVWYSTKWAEQSDLNRASSPVGDFGDSVKCPRKQACILFRPTSDETTIQMLKIKIKTTTCVLLAVIPTRQINFLAFFFFKDLFVDT